MQTVYLKEFSLSPHLRLGTPIGIRLAAVNFFLLRQQIFVDMVERQRMSLNLGLTGVETG